MFYEKKRYAKFLALIPFLASSQKFLIKENLVSILSETMKRKTQCFLPLKYYTMSEILCESCGPGM